MMSATTPEPTVFPPSRMANLNPCSIAMQSKHGHIFRFESDV